MPTATPADVLVQRRRLILNGDIDGFVDLFAPDAVIEVPFTGPPGTPMRRAGRSWRRPSRSSGSGRARLCSSATSPIPGSWKT